MLFLALALPLISLAQDTEKVEMADALYTSGKIYIVVIVLAAIFIGIIAYLISIDRKLSKLEQSVTLDK